MSIRLTGLLFTLFLIGFTISSEAQDCNINISGKVIDESSQLPLTYVNVFIQESANGVVTDAGGNFTFADICAGEYHIIFSHIGCESQRYHFDIESDTVLNIVLSHSETSLSTVVIQGVNNDLANQSNLSLDRKDIEDNNNQSIASLLQNETGVHLIKNGNGISKPVVHGLYGNRLTLLNNGIIQSGQQWGNDHSPEIDPFAADKITIIKGAGAIAYGGGNLGSVILVQPKKISKEPHLHGQVNYSYETNGRGNNLNARLEKYTPQIAFRINGTLRKYGDSKTADYYLRNTGIAEANLSIQLGKSWNQKTFADFYVSTFNNRLGVLRGSHIGNLPDLQEAIGREIPFFTEPDYNGSIDAPRQQVSHHLTKLRLKHFINDNQSIELILAGQLNDRKEYDVRRNDRSDIPSLSLLQYTFNSDLSYTHDFAADWHLKIGNQNIVTDNTNNPDTDILPLIPDYRSIRSGVFFTLSKSYDKAQFNLGARYDYEYQNVVAITRSQPPEIIRYENNFNIFSGLGSVNVDITSQQSLSLSTGYSMRNPAVNELYSNGLHQGVSGIEEGSVDLKTEKALKNTLEYKWLPSPLFSFNALGYLQKFSDYIYLQPEDKVRLTIRGAFPVFSYRQTDARIYGLDLSTQFTLRNSIIGLIKYSYLRGDDIGNDTPLIYMPPASLFGSVTFRANRSIGLTSNVKLEEVELEVSNRFVFKQNHLLEQQDFLAPPDAYNLVGLKLSTNVFLTEYKFRLFIKADNLLNTSYRDYLNRQRYFADDVGISVTAGVNLKF